MSMSLFENLPEILSSDFSIVLMEGTMLKSEKNKIKEFLRNFSYYHDFEPLEELKGMTPMVDVVLKLIAELAVRPSEVQDGLDLIKKTPSILRGIPSSCDFGEILVELVLPLTILVKKLQVFEICEARRTLQKIEAVKSLSEIMLLLNDDGEKTSLKKEEILLKRKEISEKITECMKFICEGEIGLKGVLEKASGTDLVALLSKTEEDYGSQVVQTQRRRHLMSKQIFEFKWTDEPSSRYQSRIYVNLEGDAICYVELLVHYLNNPRTIHGKMNFAGLKVYLFGEDEAVESWVMLKIALQSQDAHLVVKGHVEIRSNSDRLWVLAQEKVLMLNQKPEMIKF